MAVGEEAGAHAGAEAVAHEGSEVVRCLQDAHLLQVSLRWRLTATARENDERV